VWDDVNWMFPQVFPSGIGVQNTSVHKPRIEFEKIQFFHDTKKSKCDLLTNLSRVGPPPHLALPCTRAPGVRTRAARRAAMVQAAGATGNSGLNIVERAVLAAASSPAGTARPQRPPSPGRAVRAPAP